MTGLLSSRSFNTGTVITKPGFLYYAPSWSWAGNDESVEFTQKDKGRFPRGDHSKGSFKLVHDHLKLRDISNPYGELLTASITVSGITLPVMHGKRYAMASFDAAHLGSLNWDKRHGIEPDDYGGDKSRLALSTTGGEHGEYPLELVQEQCGTCPGSVDALKIDLETLEAYLALLIYIPEYQGKFPHSARGLLLEPLRTLRAELYKKYRRVSVFGFGLVLYPQLSVWKKKTLKLI